MPTHCEVFQTTAHLWKSLIRRHRTIELTQQGYTPDDILPRREKHQSPPKFNISGKGDSIDVTETFMDSSYQELAAAMATSMGAWASAGLTSSFQIKLVRKPIAHLYRAFNFNPSMYMHTYCVEGPGQAITPKS